MSKFIYTKKKWLKIIPVSFCSKKENNVSVFLHSKHIQHTFLNWEKIWIYIQYKLSVLKNVLCTKATFLIVTDNKQMNFSIQILAKKLQIAFIIGNWKGGCLTKIETFENLPNFILNFGILYSQHFYNEITIMNIPTINLITSKYGLKNKALNYNLFILNINKQNFYYIITFFIWFLKKYKKLNLYENFNFTAVIDQNVIKSLQFIYNKTQIFQQKTTKIWITKNKIIFKNNKQIQIKNYVTIFENTINNINRIQIFEKIYFPRLFYNFFLNNYKFRIQQEIKLKRKHIKKNKLIIKNINSFLKLTNEK